MRRAGTRIVIAGMLTCAAVSVGEGQKRTHLNPMIELHAQKKPIFGLYAPSNPRGRGNRGGAPGAAGAAPQTPPPAPPVLKTPAELVKDALAYDKSDFVFDGTMEGGVDRGIPAFTEFVHALADASTPDVRWKHPLSVKTPEIAPDPAKANDNISRQLNLGVSTDRVRRRRKRGRSEEGARGDAVQVERRHPARRRGRRRRSTGACPKRIIARRPTCGRSIPTAS